MQHMTKAAQQTAPPERRSFPGPFLFYVGTLIITLLGIFLFLWGVGKILL